MVDAANNEATEKNDKKLVAKDVLRVFDDADKGQLVALHDFDLEAEHGEIVALIGPSGCGKSTFLRLVAGLDQAQGGTIEYGGEAIKGPSYDRGFVFQETNLYPWLTVEKNIAFGLKARGVYKKQKDRAWASRASRNRIRIRFPAVWRRASPLPRRSCKTRASSCSTSRCPRSMRSRGPSSRTRS